MILMENGMNGRDTDYRGRMRTVRYHVGFLASATLELHSSLCSAYRKRSLAGRFSRLGIDRASSSLLSAYRKRSFGGCADRGRFGNELPLRRRIVIGIAAFVGIGFWGGLLLYGLWIVGFILRGCSGLCRVMLRWSVWGLSALAPLFRRHVLPVALPAFYSGRLFVGFVGWMEEI